MAKTKYKGDIAEVFVTYKLKEKGFNVLVPCGEDVRYDLVSEKDGIFKRIQVKYVTPKNGTLAVSFRSSNNYHIIHYSSRDVDIIAAYSSKQKKVYFIPLQNMSNRNACKLRLTSTKNKQKKFVVPASRYESRFDLLEKKEAGVAQW